jgi:hypothetical protein
MVGERFYWDPENPKKRNILPVFSIYIVECAKIVKNYPENPKSFVYETIEFFTTM